jgi:hypothetical protein
LLLRLKQKALGIADADLGQFRPGHYWKTNDPADLTFNEAGPKPQCAIRCFNMQDFLNRGECRDVPVEPLEFLGAGTFGEARSSEGTTRWTGDSHRYGIYRNRTGVYKKQGRRP